MQCALVVCVFICGLQLYSDKGSVVFLFVMENKAEITEVDVRDHHLESEHLEFAKCRGGGGGVEGVSKVEHGSARWGQGVFCGVEVGPGQPAGQVGLESLHLLLLPLEEQLCSDQTFISCALIQPAEEEERRGGAGVRTAMMRRLID